MSALSDFISRIVCRRPSASRRARTAGAVRPCRAVNARPDVEIVADFSLELTFYVPGVDDVAFLGHAGDDVLGIAETLTLPVGIDAVLPVVVDRAADRAFHIGVVVVFVTGPNFCIELIGRPLRDDVDRAADRVAAIECSLRTAKDFNAVDAERGATRFHRKALVDAVRVVGDARVGGEHVGLPADAAQCHAVGRRRVRHARREVRHVLDAGDADPVALFAGERGDGHRNGLNVLHAPFGRHDHGFDLREGRNREGRHQQN